MPGIRAGQLGLDSLDGCDLDPADWIEPQLVVLPMGWSWALLLCQLVLGFAISLSGVAASQLVRDRAPGVVVQPGHPAIIGYVDNYGAIGSTRDEACAARDAISAALVSLGFTVHEEEAGVFIENFLGLEFDGVRRRFRVRRARAWRLRLALQELLRRGSCTGDMMEVLLGHMTWLGMLRRESLSILNDCYRFMTEHRSKAGKFPSRVRWELKVFRDIIPLLVADAAAEWHPSLVATDASPYGLGVCQKDCPAEQAGALGRQS